MPRPQELAAAPQGGTPPSAARAMIPSAFETRIYGEGMRLRVVHAEPLGDTAGAFVRCEGHGTDGRVIRVMGLLLCETGFGGREIATHFVLTAAHLNTEWCDGCLRTNSRHFNHYGDLPPGSEIWGAE